MKIELTVTAEVVAKATLREDVLSLDVSVAVPYGNQGRKASVSESITDEAALNAVKAALQSAIEKPVANLLPKAQAASHEAYKVALNKGEE